MSTSINLSNDLNDYLKSSGSSISGQPGSSGFLNGWFSGNSKGSSDAKGWFSYQPLRTSPDEDTSSVNSGSANGAGRSGGGSWLRNPFGPKEPEPQGCLPSLVCIYSSYSTLLFILFVPVENTTNCWLFVIYLHGHYLLRTCK